LEHTVAASPTLTQVQQALLKVEQASSSILKEIWMFSRVPTEEINSKVETVAEDFIQEITGQLTDDDAPKVLERVRRRRADLVTGSDITSEIVGTCQQILAFGGAGLALSIGFADKLSSLTPAWQKLLVIAGIAYFELVVWSLIVLLLHIIQARFRYPFLYFTKIGNAWPWFYYASVSPDISRAPLQFAPSRVLAAARYAQDLIRFTDKTCAETLRDELRNEIKQYFLLLSYQGYVNQFSLHLTNLFAYGFLSSFVSAVALAIFAVVV
jgi:hypothetical protein